MTFEHWLWLIGGVLLLLSIVVSNESGTLGFILFIATACCFIGSCTTETAVAARARQEAAGEAQRRADATPHAIRKGPDGCEVFAFKADGYWHYYTRCPHAETTTDGAHGVSHKCGKSTCTETVYEQVKTEEM